MDPTNPYKPEFYENPACPFDEPHTIPAGWDVSSILESSDSRNEPYHPGQPANAAGVGDDAVRNTFS